MVKILDVPLQYMVYGMDEADIEMMLKHGYWPVVDINGQIFVAKVYKKYTRGKRKGWRLLKDRPFQTPQQAWDYLQETLYETLKFVL